jgi:hypothetical protein
MQKGPPQHRRRQLRLDRDAPDPRVFVDQDQHERQYGAGGSADVDVRRKSSAQDVTLAEPAPLLREGSLS